MYYHGLETQYQNEEMLKEVIEKVYKGTTTIGIAFNSHVVLASDKKATSGIYVAHKNVKKIVKISDRVAMTVAGLVADAQTLADYIRAQAAYYHILNNRPMPLKSMASLLGLILNEYKYFPFIVQLILGGYDYYEGPKIFAIEPFGDVTEERFTATGSGSPTAIGIIEAEYRPDLDVDKSIVLAVKAVATAIARDVFTGGVGVDVAVIGKDFYREYTYTVDDIKKILGR
ncbi:archaeal proteasome endopeptidase complex subunit beta [Ignisphaera sp. 4213-co]|uniref:Proteasome subunit beta n=1 Tax=Ignisphaera cupida TaxID=3050454 RepID=A0ABD4Z4H1_9CREN|nr:archaeal proteasome endopeptidase complex subunit beta [Ignisphaera sp. 4213-co]MDK6027823.1 archaeal proteasome endopeptidase complex subunit beta [Ignisphaera sp. 4213-co]